MASWIHLSTTMSNVERDMIVKQYAPRATWFQDCKLYRIISDDHNH